MTKLKESAAELKKKETRLLADIAKYEAERVKSVLRSGKNAFVYRAEPGLDFINMVIIEIREAISDDNVVVLASGEGTKGGQIVVIGNKAPPVENFASKIKEVLTAVKGGGRGERWQGKMTEWKKGELEALQRLVET